MKTSKFVKTAAIAGGVLFALKGLDDRLETTHYTIKSPDIPEEFDGFRIVQVSDLHAAVIPGVVEEIRSEKPDIIAATGDMADDKHSYEPAVRFADKLMDIAPVYSVTGNHDLYRTDYSSYQSALDETGTKTLNNETVILERNGAQIALSGIGDPFSEDGNTIYGNINRSIGEIKPYEGYHILLFHRANHLDAFKDKGFDLILSGHMHGGQIRLPNGKGMCNPKSSWGSGSSLFFPKYFAGHYRYKGMDMIVNRGLGNPMLLPRLFNRPEITVIILKHKEIQK